MTLSPFVVLIFTFASGFFYVLSCIEKPAWALMVNAHSHSVSDDEARLIHAELKRLIRLLPPP